jgi:hypothetical protein
MKSHRLALLPFIALLLSILLHIVMVFGDSAWALWLSGKTDAQALVLTPPTHTLTSQTVDLTGDLPAILPGIHPVDILTVRIGRPKRIAPVVVAAKPAAPKPAKPKAKLVVAKVEKHDDKPTDEAASTPADAPSSSDTGTADSTGDKAAASMGNATPSSDTVADNATPTPAATPTPTATPDPAVPVAASNDVASNDATPSARPILDTTFPNSVDITYAIKTILTAEHHWRLHGAHYQIATKATVFGLGLEMRSDGNIDQAGLHPNRYQEFRNSESTPHYQVDFDWPSSTAHFGDNAFEKDAPLQAGAEDMFSAAYQFALQGDRLKNFNIQVFTGRKDYQVPFELKGETKLRLSGQQVPVLLLAGKRETKNFEFYLAPGWHNLPVRIHFTDSDKGDDYDLIARRIAINGRVVLKPSNRQMDN